MQLKELVQEIKRTIPAQANAPEAKAVNLLREAFKLVSAEIDKLDEGVVPVAGLGKFRVRQVERTREGEKVMFKQILFHPSAGRKE